jgi:hypothetical protein
MYIVFPLAIVALAGRARPDRDRALSLTDPEQYERIVSSAHVGIAGFGGAFLGMVGLKFFFSEDKEVHWIGCGRGEAGEFGALPAIEIAVLLVALWGLSNLLDEAHSMTFLRSGMLGIAAFVAVDGLGHVLPRARRAPARHRRRDPARARRLHLPQRARRLVQLRRGDRRVRAVEQHGGDRARPVDRGHVRALADRAAGAPGTLAAYQFLEHGAFWAILALATIMLLSARYEIPETLTGLIGAAFIGLSLWWSVRHNRRHRDAKPQN